MKWLAKLSLQWRVTLLIAILLLICSIAFTVFSIVNAQRTLIPSLYDAIELSIENGDFILHTKDSEGAITDVGASFGKAKQEFDLQTIWFCLLVTVAGTAAVYFVSGKALEPVRQLKDKIMTIDEYNLSERLPDASSNDEIGSLTKSFNHALDRLEEAFERQKRFSASAAHELKTPLATIKAGIQVLSLGGDSTLSEYRDNARITLTSVDRMAQVVDDLLFLAVPADKERVNEIICIAMMLESIFAEIAPMYTARNITRLIKCDEETIQGNTALIYRVLYNLIENAYKYNRQNGSIHVSVGTKDKWVTIEIKDTGLGIPQEHLPFIFEAFYRVEASRSRKTAGSGLGLSIVKSIIDGHEGTISVSSIYGQGTEFVIRLPQ